jgi:hypothetical protein
VVSVWIKINRHYLTSIWPALNSFFSRKDLLVLSLLPPQGFGPSGREDSSHEQAHWSAIVLHQSAPDFFVRPRKGLLIAYHWW